MYIIEREYGDSSNCSCIVNLDKGEIEIYAEKTIVQEIDDYKVEITLEEAIAKEPEAAEGLSIGDVFVEVIDLRVFGRRIINTAKHFFSQKLRDVERNYIYDDYANRIGEIVIGVVHQVQRDNIYINIDQAELRLPKSEQIFSERFRRGDTVRSIIKSVDITSKGPDIIVSRSDNHFLNKLFEMEVPEIEDGIIEITSIARQPGDRAKIIVKSNDRRIDPVGACVGMKGSRIHGIVRELGNENIDVINYTNNLQLFITRSLNPARLNSMKIDEENKRVEVILNPEEVSKAIGRGGHNIRLAGQLTGYEIDVFREGVEEDVELTEFSDEIDSWVIEELAKAGLDTAKSVLEQDAEDLVKRTDLEEETINDVLKILREEFED